MQFSSGVSLINHHFRCRTESIAHMLPRMKLSALTQVHTHLFQVVLPELTEEHPGNWNCTVTVENKYQGDYLVFLLLSFQGTVSVTLLASTIR